MPLVKGSGDLRLRRRALAQRGFRARAQNNALRGYKARDNGLAHRMSATRGPWGWRSFKPCQFLVYLGSRVCFTLRRWANVEFWRLVHSQCALHYSLGAHARPSAINGLFLEPGRRGRGVQPPQVVMIFKEPISRAPVCASALPILCEN